MNRCLYILVFLFFSCDYERNNPIENEGAYAEQIVVNYGAVRDFIIIEDFSLENLHYNPFTHSCTELEQEDCYSFWCEWTEAGDYCSYKNRDIVALANDDKGLFIYELENGNIPTDLEHDYIEKIYERDLIEDVGDGESDIELRQIYYAESHNTLYMLDKFEYIYNLYLPTVLSDYNGFPYEIDDCQLPEDDFLNYLQCGQYTHSTKFSVNENNLNNQHDIPFEMFVLYKENASTCSDCVNPEFNGGYVDGEYSEIRQYWYNNDPNGNETSSAVCDNTIAVSYSCDIGDPLIGPLNYDVTDIHFDKNNNYLFIANPSNDFHSINQYFYDPFGQNVLFKDDIVFESKINVVETYGDYLIAGMKDGGCYITLLNETGISDNNHHKLHIGENFSVYNIHYNPENYKLVLSCGFDGVLIYDWNGIDLELYSSLHIQSTSNSYVAKTYQDKLIIGTGEGLEIFNIGD